MRSRFWLGRRFCAPAARGTLMRLFTEQVDGVYIANVADEKAEPELKLLGGLQAVLFNIHVCHLFVVTLVDRF
jgi:hypothetical protein